MKTLSLYLAVGALAAALAAPAWAGGGCVRSLEAGMTDVPATVVDAAPAVPPATPLPQGAGG